MCQRLVFLFAAAIVLSQFLDGNLEKNVSFFSKFTESTVGHGGGCGAGALLVYRIESQRA